MKKDIEELLQRKKEQKDFERELQCLNKEEQKKYMDERNKQEADREWKYKKHFEDYDKVMEGRIKAHIESVSSPEGQRTKQIYDWIHKNEAEYQEKLKKKEQELSEWRKLVSFSLSTSRTWSTPMGKLRRS